MHHYDCPCDECRVGAVYDSLFERVLTVIERLEDELARPPAREYEEALAWLGRVCGGPDAVASLDERPLTDAPEPAVGQRPEAVRALLDSVAREFFDPEMRLAFRRALAAVWNADPGLVLGPAAPAYVAAGIAWTLGQANGLVGPQRQVTAAVLRHYLGIVSSPAVHARPIRRVLGEAWPWPASRPSELLELGRTDLLLGRTRARLIRVREHALGDRAADDDAAGDSDARRSALSVEDPRPATRAASWD